MISGIDTLITDVLEIIFPKSSSETAKNVVRASKVLEHRIHYILLSNLNGASGNKLPDFLISLLHSIKECARVGIIDDEEARDYLSEHKSIARLDFFPCDSSGWNGLYDDPTGNIYLIPHDIKT